MDSCNWHDDNINTAVISDTGAHGLLKNNLADVPAVAAATVGSIDNTEEWPFIGLQQEAHGSQPSRAQHISKALCGRDRHDKGNHWPHSCGYEY